MEKFVKVTIIESPIGIFGFDENKKIVEKIFFPKDALKTAKKLKRIEEGEIIEEISDLVVKLQKKGYTEFIFENQNVSRKIIKKLNINIISENTLEAGNQLRENLEKYAVDLGFANKKEKVRTHIHNVSIELAKIKVKKTVEKRDLLASQAVQSIDDLDKSLNLLISRLREWFGLHYPELDRLIEKHETYVRLVVNLGNRENFTLHNLEKEGLPKIKSRTLSEVAAASMGADLDQKDLAQIQALSTKIFELYETRKSLEKYVDLVMDDVAPNIKTIAGSLLGARLIALSGGLLNLAKLPASTIQVLGAEKALFRSLKTKARPPKHGIIFQHPFIHDAKRWQRGKIARALAGKLSIAARVDAFSGRFSGEKLESDLTKRIEEIKERYKKPPSQQEKQKKNSNKKLREKKKSRRKKRGIKH
jgi:nucleolar protein 56